MTVQNKHSPSHFENTWLGQTGIFCLLHFNHLQTVYCQNKGSLFCASLSCVFVKKKDMILAGELQFYQLQKRKNKKNSGSDGIWTQASQNITANWATEVNVNSSALMPTYFYRTLHSPWIFASVTFWSLCFKCFLKCV